MAGINTLQEIYKKRGEEWTRNFLSSGLRVSEKTEAYRFSFEISKSGKLRYYGKNAERPLNRIDRALSDLYEGAIEKISNLPDAITLNLPKSHRFGCSWTPESGLKLTDITIRQNGKVIKEIGQKELLEKWATLLHIHNEEVIEGVLESTIVESMMSSLREGVNPVFAGQPGKTYILKGADGIAKIAPLAEREVREQKSHSFDLLLLQIYEQISTIDLTKFSFRSERPDDRYIEFVCEAFNQFVHQRGKEFVEMGVQKPAFLERSGKLNRRWIKNSATLALLESNREYEYLLGIFLANLRKPKKAGGLLSESFVANFNEKIGQIEECVRNVEDYEFPEFNSILEKEERHVDLRDDAGFSEDDQLRAVGMMQTYFSRPFQNTSEDAEKPVHECNLLLINTGQVTNKVIRECERLLQLTNKGFVIVHDVAAGASCQWGLDQRDGDLVAHALVKDHPHIFECCESMKNPDLQKLLGTGGERSIKRIYTGRSCEYFVKEAETLNCISGNPVEVEIQKIGASEDKAIQSCMEEEDYKSFRQLFPPAVQQMWSQMQSSWQKRAYL